MGKPIQWETIPNTEEGHRNYLERFGLDDLVDLHKTIWNKSELEPYTNNEKYNKDPVIHMFMDIYIKKCLVALGEHYAPED